jgi:hypothetical protein
MDWIGVGQTVLMLVFFVGLVGGAYYVGYQNGKKGK